ncbi:aldehyde dehydrogenase 3, member A2 [Clonorchis sinensis]|uniref:Aldehyde dehydrogenase 3, member A2 n=1 Tax=Clonorchis sinensis TaxID=79923 RepID=A0A419QHL9_CLOSI|nr:aldehyde dehydrogenase 3, member A2 [Clonorchis sinensis]
MLAYMDDWLKDEAVPRSFMTIMDTSYIQRQPLGVILIMGAWNYPLCTLLIPMLGALAAGNTVLLKPSEHCPTVARLLATLVPNYVDKKICQVLCGGVDVCQKLLASERFDHILYTGGVGGGRAVYAAAAKFLTPVTLELGGKCPVYVDSNVDLMMAAKRITVIKNFNCGQTCVAPDYVICHRKVLDEFLKNLGEAIEEFYGKDKRASPDLSRIINEMHWKRLTKLLSETKGKTVYGGEVVHDDLYIAPTVVIDVGPDDSLMSEELFGPILPILTVDSPKEAVELIRPRAHPLAVYVFTNSNDVFEIFKEETTSGALVQNDCGVQTLSAELPFGGVGQSGFGRYHGKHSIYTFSNPRSVMLKSRSEFINQSWLAGDISLAELAAVILRQEGLLDYVAKFTTRPTRTQREVLLWITLSSCNRLLLIIDRLSLNPMHFSHRFHHPLCSMSFRFLPAEVRHGDPLSPLLFIMAMDDVLRLSMSHLGYQSHNTLLDGFSFADGCVVLFILALYDRHRVPDVRVLTVLTSTTP